MAAMRITLPARSLVLLIGPAGSGKTSFARAHFGPTEVISSDFCRALVADDQNDQSATDAAFEVLHLVVHHRLRRRRLTVVDATNVRPADRRGLLAMARKHGAPSVAIVFDVAEELSVERDRTRTDRTVGPAVIRRQRNAMLRSLPDLEAEGFAAVYVLDSPEAVARAGIDRTAGVPDDVRSGPRSPRPTGSPRSPAV
jgi:protein phosphatase